MGEVTGAATFGYCVIRLRGGGFFTLNRTRNDAGARHVRMALNFSAELSREQIVGQFEAVCRARGAALPDYFEIVRVSATVDEAPRLSVKIS